MLEKQNFECAPSSGEVYKVVPAGETCHKRIRQSNQYGSQLNCGKTAVIMAFIPVVDVCTGTMTCYAKYYCPEHAIQLAFACEEMDFT
jgi:hypothetical protein